MLFPELENANAVVEADWTPGVVDGVELAGAALKDATGEDENVAVLEKVEEDVTGEIGKVVIFDEKTDAVFRLDDALLADSGALDLESAVVPTVPKNEVLAGFVSVDVLSDFGAATVEVLEPKLIVGNAGSEDETGGLLLDTEKPAMVVNGAVLTAGLSVGVVFDNFGGDVCDKPLLRLGEVDAAEAKWRGGVNVGAAVGNTLSDDLWMSPAPSLPLPFSKLGVSNDVGLVTLSPSLPLVFTPAAVDVSKSDVLDGLAPNIKGEALVCLSSLFEANGTAETVASGRSAGGTCGNVKPVLLFAETVGVAFFSGSLDENKPDVETSFDVDFLGCSVTEELITFSFDEVDSTFCSN